jgi:hypothetical protein
VTIYLISIYERIIRSLLDVTTRRSLEGVWVQKDFVYMIPLVRCGLPNLPLGDIICVLYNRHILYIITKKIYVYNPWIQEMNKVIGVLRQMHMIL